MKLLSSTFAFRAVRPMLAAALLLALSPFVGQLAAQQPDSIPSRDSAGRRDSIARHDSLLFERARQRIEGEAESRVPPRELDKPIRRGIKAPRLRASAGATTATDFARDEDGVEASVAPALIVGVAVAFDAMLQTIFTAGLRVSRSASQLAEEGEEWSSGQVTVLDFALGAERDIGSRFAVRGAAVIAFIEGPEAVVPFGGNAYHLGGEIGASVRLLRSTPLALAVAAQPLRFGGTSVVAPGTVTRFIVELRYGR